MTTPSNVSFDLYNGDCIKEMEQIADDSVDMIFVDLPYGQVSCAWDKKIDLEKMWVHFMRIKKLRTPIFMTCSTKFGAELIAGAPKKCPFRWDIVWVKSSPVGFLSARKMPMRKHEMMYAFYERLPLYDISSHTHKFLKKVNKVEDKTETLKKDIYGRNHKEDAGLRGSYQPPLPTSVVADSCRVAHREAERVDQVFDDEGSGKSDVYGKIKREKNRHLSDKKYDPPLPNSIIKESETGEENPNLIYDQATDPEFRNGTIDGNKVYKGKKVLYRNAAGLYDPRLPVSVLEEEKKEDIIDCYNTKERFKNGKLSKDLTGKYDPALPVSVLKEEKKDMIGEGQIYNEGKEMPRLYRAPCGPAYEPALPVSVLNNEKEMSWRKKTPDDGLYKPFKTKDTSIYGGIDITTNYVGRKGGESAYKPPLPTSVQEHAGPSIYNNQNVHLYKDRKGGEPAYEPPLPTTVQTLPPDQQEDLLSRLINPEIEEDYLNEVGLPHSILEIKSQKGKHSTQKPLDLMKWCIKYFTKEGDTVLDNTMGSGSTGVACKEMGRSFIGIELDPDIFEVACDRILD